MKKIFLLMFLIIAIIMILTNIVFAEEETATEVKTKPVVATIYINNAKSTYDEEITKKLTDRFNSKLTMYEVRSGAKYIEKLNKMGVTDITTAERADIIQAFSDEGIDYVVYAEVQPPILKNWQSFFNIGVAATVTIPVKIIDIRNNKYLYNGKFTEQADNSSMLGGVGTKAAVIKAMDQIFVKTDEILTNRLPVK